MYDSVINKMSILKQKIHYYYTKKIDVQSVLKAETIKIKTITI